MPEGLQPNSVVSNVYFHNGGGSQGGWPPWMHNSMQPSVKALQL